MAKNLAHNIDEKIRTSDILPDADHNFDFLLLSAPVSLGLQDAGFYKPSPIQLKAIPLGKCGLDLIVKSKSGTGKTLVYTIIALEMINVTRNVTQVLIIAPTREIADQIVSVITTIGKHIEGLNVGLFIGGLGIEKDIKNAKKCHIAVGAPGRVRHLVEKNHLDIQSVKLFVLDEADKLMHVDFQSDINFLHYKLPNQKQFLAVSATIPSTLDSFLNRYMRSPRFVTPEFDSSVLLGLRQFITIVEEQINVPYEISVKVDELVRLLSDICFTQCLVFSNYQVRTNCLSNLLNQKGWKTMHITGSQSQENRLKVVRKLKKLECKILLTTDLTARGIDASNVDLVINFDVPYDAETYLHRMGRAGRYGSLGLCITIASNGKELTDFKNLLGDIGGNEMSIAQLPVGRITQDVWKDDLNLFEQVFGVYMEREKTSWELDSNSKKNISNKFRALTVNDAQRSSDSTTPQGGVSNSDDSTASLLDPQINVEKILHMKEMEKKDIAMQYAEISSTDLLKSLAQGVNLTGQVTDFVPKQSQHVNVTNAQHSSDSTIAQSRVSKSDTNTEKILHTTEVDEKSIASQYLEISSVDLLKSLAQGETPSDFVINNSKKMITDSTRNLLESDDDIKKILHTKEVEEKNIGLSNLEFTSDDLLKSLAQGDDHVTAVNQNLDSKLVSPAALYPWVPVENPVLSNYKKDSVNLLDSPEGSLCGEDDSIRKEIYKRKLTLSKNIALYHVSKMIQSPDWDMNEIDDAVKPIQDYFNISQGDYVNFTRNLENSVAGVDNKELCQNITHYTEQFAKTQVEDNLENSPKENICMAAYNYIINGTNNWRQMVEVDNKNENQNKVCPKDMDVVNEPEACNESGACDIDPVQYNNYNDYFSAYYDYYDATLAETAPTFQDVPSFNRWFEQWQGQVKSVTSYVQQKIYLQEMNNYEYYQHSHH